MEKRGKQGIKLTQIYQNLYLFLNFRSSLIFFTKVIIYFPFSFLLNFKWFNIKKYKYIFKTQI